MKLPGSVIRFDEPPRAEWHVHRLRHNAVVDELMNLRTEAVVAEGGDARLALIIR